MKANVLHIIDSFDQGGTERQALQVVRQLRGTGRYKVHLACLKKRGLLLDESQDLLLDEVVEFPITSFYDRNFLTQLRRLRTLLAEREIQLVHTHDFYTNVFGMTGASFARIPARIASKRETSFRTSNQQRVERWAFLCAHRIIANSEAVRRSLVEQGVEPGKLRTLYNGLDLARVRVQAGWTNESGLASLGLEHLAGRPLVSLVANLRHRVKNIPLFLRAAKRVKEAIPEAAFIIAGEGELLEELLAEVTRLELHDHVFFIGRCTQVADLLALSSVCVLTSSAEGFSNSILEYMAAGRPVVATDVGGAREVIKEDESGYLVASGDEENLARYIVKLLQNPQGTQHMGDLGRKIIEQRFSCEAQLERTEQLYAEVLRMG